MVIHLSNTYCTYSVVVLSFLGRCTISTHLFFECFYNALSALNSGDAGDKNRKWYHLFRIKQSNPAAYLFIIPPNTPLDTVILARLKVAV